MNVKNVQGYRGNQLQYRKTVLNKDNFQTYNLYKYYKQNYPESIFTKKMADFFKEAKIPLMPP